MSAHPDRRGLLRAALTSAAAAVAAMILVAAGAHWLVPPAISGPIADGGWTNRTRGWFTARGFHPAEIDQATQARYSWTTDSARIVVPHLDRRQPYALTFAVSAVRPEGVALPRVDVLVDGTRAASLQTTVGASTVIAAVPARAIHRATVIIIQASSSFVPGPGDPRVLGVVVHDVRLAPDSGHFSAAWPVVGTIGLAVALAVAGVLVCGLGGAAGATAAIGIPCAFVWLTLQDGAFIGTFGDALLHIGAGIAAAGAAVALLRWRWPLHPDLPDWSLAAGLVLAATAVKLAVFDHPLATIGDGIFQLHRAQLVRGGSYFFTSITPRPFFEFPYAIGLYVAALPFWSWFPTELDQVHLLRGLAVVADALVGVAFYAVAYRQWRDRRAALLVAGLWPFARAPLEALCNSNLTNVFAQGLFGVGLAAIAWLAVAGSSAVAVLAALAFITAGFLSHFSTFSVGVPLVGAIGLVLAVAGRGIPRRAGWMTLLIGALAIAIAYAVYYSHFTQVYRTTWARIASHETATGPGSAIAATPAEKLQRWASGTSDDYGLPGIVVALAGLLGAIALVRTRARDGITLVLLTWLAAWIGFTVLGLLTAIQMRVNLAAAPLFTCLGAYGLAVLAGHSRAGRGVATVATVVIALNGARLWLMCLGR